MGVLKKKCSTCQSANKLDNSTRAHRCNVNHKDGSGAMESSLALTLTIGMFEKSKQKVCISKIVTNYDSTMQAHIKNLRNGGKIPDHIPQPEFLADPSHRVKVMVKPIFKLVSSVKDPIRLSKQDYA